jgi:hypothetical protein
MFLSKPSSGKINIIRLDNQTIQAFETTKSKHDLNRVAKISYGYLRIREMNPKLL